MHIFTKWVSLAVILTFLPTLGFGRTLTPRQEKKIRRLIAEKQNELNEAKKTLETGQKIETSYGTIYLVSSAASLLSAITGTAALVGQSFANAYSRDKANLVSEALAEIAALKERAKNLPEQTPSMPFALKEAVDVKYDRLGTHSGELAKNQSRHRLWNRIAIASLVVYVAARYFNDPTSDMVEISEAERSQLEATVNQLQQDLQNLGEQVGANTQE